MQGFVGMVKSWNYSTQCGVRLATIAMLICFAATAMAQPTERPRLQTNQDYLEEVTRRTALDIDDRLAVFAYVFDSLPERVKVYPTENYYYFSFYYNGAPYDGNIRLDASDRDQGKVHFGYSESISEWREETPVNYIRLDESHGVKVEKLERFLYRVTYGNKSVIFELNDLSQVKPPATALGPDEQFIGPIFDESGIRFFLVHNSRFKIFHYILDETVLVADQFVVSPRTDRILIGKRTAYAFYRDQHLDRKILIGVYEANARVNNYFDGPFDQLPDNFLEGDILRRLILEIEPDLDGKIDRFGGSPDGSERYMIAPYLYYQAPDDLYVFEHCATSRRVPPARYATCFVIDEPEQSGRPLPRGLTDLDNKPRRRGGSTQQRR